MGTDPKFPLTDAELASVEAFADQVVARGLMASSSVEIETLRRLVRDQRGHQQRVADLGARTQEALRGWFTWLENAKSEAWNGRQPRNPHRWKLLGEYETDVALIRAHWQHVAPLLVVGRSR